MEHVDAQVAVKRSNSKTDTDMQAISQPARPAAASIMTSDTHDRTEVSGMPGPVSGVKLRAAVTLFESQLLGVPVGQRLFEAYKKLIPGLQDFEVGYAWVMKALAAQLLLLQGGGDTYASGGHPPAAGHAGRDLPRGAQVCPGWSCGVTRVRLMIVMHSSCCCAKLHSQHLPWLPSFVCPQAHRTPWRQLGVLCADAGGGLCSSRRTQQAGSSTAQRPQGQPRGRVHKVQHSQQLPPNGAGLPLCIHTR